MKLIKIISIIAALAIPPACHSAQEKRTEASVFSYDRELLARTKPWTDKEDKEFKNNPEEFQFVIIGDRTRGANVLGTFK